MSKTIVITGSTRGIGYGLAEQFLGRGYRVVVNGRSSESVAQAVFKLKEKYPTENILGQAGDVGQFDQVEKLWQAGVKHFGQVDIWINNAGLSHTLQKIWELPPKEIDAVVRTNLTGSMYGAKVAINGMLAQGFGAVYFMEGAGGTGRMHPGLLAYASSKRGLNYLIEGLAEEVEGTGVIVAGLSPGMVVTDLLKVQLEIDPAERKRVERIFNILADRAETITPWFAEQILANQKNGRTISWLTRGKVLKRFLMAGFVKRDLFKE